MLTRRQAFFTTLSFGVAVLGGGAAVAQARRRGALQTVDTDNDGTIDLKEAQAAAGALFDKLDADHDGTLDRRELKRRISAKDFAAGDPDKDKSLSKDEYLALVAQRFKAADADNDGTVSAAELKTRAGRALLRLLR